MCRYNLRPGNQPLQPPSPSNAHFRFLNNSLGRLSFDLLNEVFCAHVEFKIRCACRESSLVKVEKCLFPTQPSALIFYSFIRAVVYRIVGNTLDSLSPVENDLSFGQFLDADIVLLDGFLNWKRLHVFKNYSKFQTILESQRHSLNCVKIINLHYNFLLDFSKATYRPIPC